MYALAGNGGYWHTKTSDTQPGRAFPQMDFPRLNSEPGAETTHPKLIKRLSDRCVQYGVNGPHNFFADYDRHGRGTCTIAQFRAAMMLAFGASYMKTDLTEKECQLLEEHYARTLLDGEVHVKWKANPYPTPNPSPNPNLNPNPNPKP